MSRQSDLAILLLALGAEEEDHAFPLQRRHIVRFAVLGKVISKACQEEFSLLFEDDGASAEEDIGFDLVALLEELDGMFELEVVIMVIRLRTETDFLDLLLLLVSLRLFLFLLLRVEELLVINNTADRRIRCSRNLDEVEVLLISHLHSLLKRVDALLYIVAYKAHLLNPTYLVVNTMRVLFDNSTTAWPLRNSCYSFSF